jgi:hypothetical protein
MDSSNFSQVASAAIARQQLSLSLLPALPFVLSLPCSPYRRTISSLSVDPVANGYRVTGGAGMLPNYAFEQSGNGWRVGAAGAWEQSAPAAPSTGVPRSAQRGRYTSN